MSSDNKTDLLAAEYAEAVSAYFKGVDIGLAYIKMYIVLNVGLLAAMGLSFSEDSKDAAKVAKALNLQLVVPLVGLFFAFCLLAIRKFYREQLRGCSARAADIEKTFGGELFTRIHKMAEEDGRVVTASGFITVFGLLGLCLWIWVLFMTGKFDFLLNLCASLVPKYL